MWPFDDKLTRLEKKRRALLERKEEPAALRAIYEQALPDAATPLTALSFLSLDFETTGLDVTQESVISRGGVELSNLEILFEKGFHRYLKADPQKLHSESTAVIHHITAETLAHGDDPYTAMEELVKALAGKILIAHAATIEKSFLIKTLNLPQDTFLPLITVDTLFIERSLSTFSGRTSDLSLSRIRERRLLPPYVAHNAFADAVAAAEVFLAQLADIFGPDLRKATLGQLMTRLP